MDEKITQVDLDLLADIIWWLKGYASARVTSGFIDDLGSAHLEVLRKVRMKFLGAKELEPMAGTPEPPF